ncbi:MAG: hypothetical protein ACI8PT_002088 [Gammaproteobacteria bacterium]
MRLIVQGSTDSKNEGGLAKFPENFHRTIAS